MFFLSSLFKKIKKYLTEISLLILRLIIDAQPFLSIEYRTLYKFTFYIYACANIDSSQQPATKIIRTILQQMHTKTYLLIALLFSYISVTSQTTIAISISSTQNSKLQINRLNNPDLNGSLIYSGKSSGLIASLSTITYIQSKLGLKLKLSAGYFNNDIIFYASPEFINFGQILQNDTYNLINRNASFSEFSAGANFPLTISKNHNLNFSLSGKVSLVTPQFIEPEYRAAFYTDDYGNQIQTPFLVGEVMLNSNQLKSGIEAEIMYQFKSGDPFGFQFGIVGSYSFKPYLNGTFDFIGYEETLYTEVNGFFRYLALYLGICHTLKPFEF